MIISCRHRALLLRLAESPNAYPWNVDSQSKLEGNNGKREHEEIPEQTILKLKVRKDINTMQKGVPLPMNQLQSIQVLKSLQGEDEEEAPTKGKPKNADKERKN